MCVDSCGRRFDRAFSMKSWLASYQELFGKVTLREFETRTLNPERAAHFLPDFFAFIARLTLSNIKSECNAISALISKIVVSSVAIVATSISAHIFLESLIIYCL